MKQELLSSTKLVQIYGRKSADVKRAVRQGYKRDPELYYYEETREKAGNGKMSIVYLVNPEIKDILFKKVYWTKALVEEWLTEQNSSFILLSDKFTNSSEKHLWKCKLCNKVKPISFASIKGTKNKKGCVCDRCSGYEKHTVAILQARIDKAPEKYKDLKLVRKGEGRNFVWLCNYCDEEWEASWQTIKSGNRCWDCNQNGQYTVKNAEENADLWKKSPALVYVIKCWDEKEWFYKIGITCNSVKQRFHAKQDMPYTYEVIHEIVSNKYHSTYLEHHLHSKHKPFKYRPNIKFDGYTECFSQLDEGVIEMFLGENLNFNTLLNIT